MTRKELWFSPVTLYYDLSKSKELGYMDENGILDIEKEDHCEAVWISGYTKPFDNKIDTKKFSGGVQITLTREQGEGYDKDIAFSLEVEQNRMMEKQLELQQQQANRQALDSLNRSLQQSSQQIQEQNRQWQQMQQNFELQQMNRNPNQINRTFRGY